ncbi:hypothetical protein HUU62_07095 [Rhodoferax sp. 4810]|uniref:Uncharacterized protein n=1 Tax=Thiospirillum jenense TaxID=1653858 RepID=A0A839H858_9GAMM|nr:hypothetical protein [Thiospirillum jenense]MBB1074180.1 hypothetical protein [Rhodoferax jenense]MBB1125254.1 hypothetical protein [Thiospirillum jenense]
MLAGLAVVALLVGSIQTTVLLSTTEQADAQAVSSSAPQTVQNTAPINVLDEN